MRTLSFAAASVLTLALVAACGDDDTPTTDGGAPPGDGAVGGDDGGERNGCNRLVTPVASPGDPIEGDTYETFASGFFDSYCVRCHSTTLTTVAERNGAPLDRNWDDEASVRENLDLIRMWVGDLVAMPIGDPQPTCEERYRLIRWIDADAP